MVITDKTVMGLEDAVRLGLSHGVADFYFAGLYKNKDVTDGINVYPVKTLPRPQLQEALRSLERAIDLVKNAGCKLQVHDGLMQGIKSELAKENDAPEIVETNSNIHTWDSPLLSPVIREIASILGPLYSFTLMERCVLVALMTSRLEI